MKELRLAVLASGSGTNLQSIIDACRTGILKGRARVKVVISDKADAFALERAEQNGIEAICLNRKDYTSNADYMAQLNRLLIDHTVDLVCCAGFLKILEEPVVSTFKDKIINIHPSLLPKYGGKGMYGYHVHEAVIAAGETESGCTVHVIDSGVDTGPTLLQARVSVRPNDTAETLAVRILKDEHRIYPLAILGIYEKQSEEKV